MTPEDRHIQFTNDRACSYGKNKEDGRVETLSVEILVSWAASISFQPAANQTRAWGWWGLTQPAANQTRAWGWCRLTQPAANRTRAWGWYRLTERKCWGRTLSKLLMRQAHDCWSDLTAVELVVGFKGQLCSKSPFEPQSDRHLCLGCKLNLVPDLCPDISTTQSGLHLERLEKHLKAWSVKGIVHPKMRITPRFTHPRAILGVTLFFQVNPIGVIFKSVWALPSCIMAVNGFYFSLVQKKSNKVHPSIIKCASLQRIDAFL